MTGPLEEEEGSTMATMAIRLNMGLCHAPLAPSTPGPNLQHWSLPNGTRCVMAPMPDAPLTCIDFWCKAGSSVERPGEEGLAHFLEHMVFKGSADLAAGEFDRKIEALGGSSNAATGFDDVHFHVLVPPNAAAEALGLLLNLVLSPALRAEAYATERSVVLEEIAQYRDQPDEQMVQQLLEACCPNHPYGRAILGFESSLQASDPEQMRAFHSRCYRGPNCCIAIAGAIPQGLQDMLGQSSLAQLNSEANEAADSADFQAINFQTGRSETHIARLESSRILMAWPLPSANNQAMVMGADLATTLFAEGRRSRLVQHLREELQIVESIEMDITVLEQGSLVMLEACCKEEQLEQVEKEIQHLLQASLSAVPQPHELKRANQLVSNGLCFSLEAPSQVAGLAGSQALWHRSQPLLAPLDHLSTWTGTRLQEAMLPLLQPEGSFTLIAKPLEVE